jgi:hypothetical protein
MSYSATLKAMAGAHTGIAPVNLLDVEDTNGNLHYWADRAIDVPVVLTGEVNATTDIEVSVPAGQSVAWAFPSKAVAVSGGQSQTASVSYLSNMSETGKCSATFTVGAHGPAFSDVATVTWSEFTLDNLPTNAIIQKVDIVMAFDCTSYLDGFTHYGSVTLPSGTFDSQQFSSSTICSTRAQIAAFEAFYLAGVGGSYAGTSIYHCTFCALAIYYTNGDTTSTTATISYPGTAATGSGPYIPWLLSVPQFSFHRSLVSDTGEFILQNLSGDMLSRDFEKIVRRSTLEGAMYVYRLWHVEAEEALIEVHGTFSVNDIGPDSAKLTAGPLINAASTDCPLESYCETCQLDWGGVRCASTESTECSYSFQTCQVPRRFMGVLNHYEKNYGEATANTAQNVINRRRRI